MRWIEREREASFNFIFFRKRFSVITVSLFTGERESEMDIDLRLGCFLTVNIDSFNVLLAL